MSKLTELIEKKKERKQSMPTKGSYYSKKEDISNIIPKEIIDMIGIKPNDDVKVSRDEKGRTLVEIRRKSR